MMQRNLIGFDRRLDKEWFDTAAALMAEGKTEADIRARLTQILQSGQGTEAVQKTLVVLGRLWWRARKELLPLQTRALSLLAEVEPTERIAIHWALCLAVYPLFLDVARLIGRLLSLQDEVKLKQVEDRIAEFWGDRPTICRAVQRITRSMVQWGVLHDTAVAGVYEPATKLNLTGETAALLVEALLCGEGKGSLTADDLYGHPAFFPFKMEVRSHDLRQRSQFEVLRQGVDLEIVMLRPAKP